MNTLELTFDWLLAASLRASLIGLAVLGVQWLMRRWLPASWRYALWLPVVLVLLLPLLPTRPWSLGFSSAPPEPPVVAQMQTGELPVLPTTALATAAPETKTMAIHWKRVGLWTWLVGACAGLALTAASYLRTFRNHVVRPAAMKPGVMAMIASEVERLGLRRMPELRLVPDTHSPAVAGLLQPLLLLPTRFPEGFTDGEARLIIRHELMHVRRYDLPVNWLLCALQCVHWFNPLLWFVFAQMRADRELACDAAVLGAGEADHRADYGHALLKLQDAGPFTAASLALVGIFGRGAAIRGRITRIADFKPAHYGWNVFSGLLLAALTFLGVTRAQPASAAADADKHAQLYMSSKFIETSYALAKHGQVLENAEFQALLLKASQTPGSDLLSAPSVKTKIGQEATVEVMLKEQTPPAADGKKRFLGCRLEVQSKLVKDKISLTANAITGLSSEPREVNQVDWTRVRMADAKATASLKPDQFLVLVFADPLPGRYMTVFVQAQAIDPVTGKLRSSFVSDIPKKGSVNAPLLGASEAPAKDLTEWNRKKLEQIIFPHIAFVGATLEEAVEFLRVQSRALDTAESDPKRKGVNILIRPNMSGKPRAAQISLNLTNVPLGEALKYVAELTEYEITVKPAWVELRSKADEQQASNKAPSPKVRPVPAEGLEVEKKIKQIVLPRVAFVGATVEEAVEFLRIKGRDLDTQESDPQRKGVNIVMDVTKVDPTIRITLDLTSVPLYEALLYTASLAKLEMSIGSAGVLFSPPALAPEVSEVKVPSGRAVETARKLVLKRVEFSSATLDEALEFIQIKARELDPAKRGFNIVLKPGANPGVRLTLSLKEIPVWEALRYVTELAALEIEAAGDTIVLTPKAK